MEHSFVEPKAVSFSAEDFNILRDQFNKCSEITSFADMPWLCSMVASVGIYKEIGTVNDELARFIFDSKMGSPVPLNSLKAELVMCKNLFGVRITSSHSCSLELRSNGFYDVVHPTLARNTDGTFKALYIFPEIINKIAKAQNVELVIVKRWGFNSIFGGFDPSKEFYQTNFWEIENNDSLQFADLIRQRKIAFLGTHDLIAHVAGIDQKHWPLLQEISNKVYNVIKNYFSSVRKPSIASLILPYTIGVILDDLAQPPSYSSPGHIAVLNELVDRLSKNQISADLRTILSDFPIHFQKVIQLSRTKDIESDHFKIVKNVDSLIREIQRSTFTI